MIDFEIPVIWITYPPGCAGDFLGFLISRHYCQTATEFSFNETVGKCNFIPSDNKIINQLNNLDIDQNFYYAIAKEIGDKSFCINQLDCLIFSNHWVSNKDVKHILSSIKNVKIIRIVPRTKVEYHFCFLSRMIKNRLSEYNTDELELYIKQHFSRVNLSRIIDQNILELSLSDFLIEKNFETFYSQLTDFLDIDIKMISKEILKYYYKIQTPEIKQILDELNHGH
jgi:hypothetical protein